MPVGILGDIVYALRASGTVLIGFFLVLNVAHKKILNALYMNVRKQCFPPNLPRSY